MHITLGQQYNVGEKPTVILYTYIISHPAGTLDKNKNKNKNIVSGTKLNKAVVNTVQSMVLNSGM